MIKNIDKAGYFKKLNDLRAFYKEHEQNIIDATKAHINSWYISYITNYHSFFSSIEVDAWNSIRTKGGIVLYPQYPIESFFVDFGNPYLKIALELDGAAWHKDKDKDKQRDLTLQNLGWTIYRITGKEMMRTNYAEGIDIETGDRDEIEYWIMNTGDGMIEAMKCVYFCKHEQEEYMSDQRGWFLALCKASLNVHNIWGEKWLE